MVVGNPVVSNPIFYNTLNAAAFSLPAACSGTRQTMDCFGNAGAGSIIEVPTNVNNWEPASFACFDPALADVGLAADCALRQGTARVARCRAKWKADCPPTSGLRVTRPERRGYTDETWTRKSRLRS